MKVQARAKEKAKVRKVARRRRSEVYHWIGEAVLVEHQACQHPILVCGPPRYCSLERRYRWYQ